MTPESLTPFATEFWIDAGVALLCGAMFGIERTLRQKQVGLVVCVLVVYGTNLFIAIGGVLTATSTIGCRGSLSKQAAARQTCYAVLCQLV